MLVQRLAVAVGMVNFTLFAAVGAWAVYTARREASPRLRSISWLIVVVCGAMLLGSAQRLSLLAQQAGMLPDPLERALVADWQVAKSLVTLALAAIGLVLVRRTGLAVRRVESLTAALTGSADGPGGSIATNALSPRELDVLELISLGTTTDEQIAAALHISPATAKTHVRNILAKTGAGSRNRLLLLTHTADPAVGRRRRADSTRISSDDRGAGLHD